MVGESSSFVLRSVRGGVTPRTGFLGAMGTNALSVISLRIGRSSEGPEFGLAHYFWAGPYTNKLKNITYFLKYKKYYPNKYYLSINLFFKLLN